MLDEVDVDKMYKITLIDEKQVPEFLTRIHEYLKAEPGVEEFGADWFLEHYVYGIPAQEVAEKLNKKSNKTYVTMMYIDKFRRFLEKGYLSNAAILALKNDYYPKAIFLTGYGNADLRLGEKNIEVKLRRFNSKQPLEDMIDSKHVKDFLDNNQSVELVLIRYGIIRCVIERYKVEKV